MVSPVRKVTHARVMKNRLYDSQVRDHVTHLGLNVNSSTHNCGVWCCYIIYGSNVSIIIIIIH